LDAVGIVDGVGLELAATVVCRGNHAGLRLLAVIWATVPAGRKEADRQCSRALIGKPWARLMSNAGAAQVAQEGKPQGSCLLESIEMLEAA